jgi:hypothetical protein
MHFKLAFSLSTSQHCVRHTPSTLPYLQTLPWMRTQPFKGHRVRRFSTTTEPFAASKRAVAHWFPQVSFHACTHF